ncbi:hypothetical protein, partial [Escherichia coli]|uniref:hypothetical protein n=1 Tax=Escherichia coli TaxID=562 RepID=UPI00225B5810
MTVILSAAGAQATFAHPGRNVISAAGDYCCLLYTSPSPRDTERSRNTSCACKNGGGGGGGGGG